MIKKCSCCTCIMVKYIPYPTIALLCIDPQWSIHCTVAWIYSCHCLINAVARWSLHRPGIFNKNSKPTAQTCKWYREFFCQKGSACAHRSMWIGSGWYDNTTIVLPTSSNMEMSTTGLRLDCVSIAPWPGIVHDKPPVTRLVQCIVNAIHFWMATWLTELFLQEKKIFLEC